MYPQTCRQLEAVGDLTPYAGRVFVCTLQVMETEAPGESQAG
jgi:hypothetical protein